MSHDCDTCQACDRPRNILGPIASAPISPALMANVAIDIFQMPTGRSEGKTYDSMIVFVDRHSGWIVAVPDFVAGTNRC